MRIALVGPGILPIPPDGYGAVEKHIANLAQHLSKRGHEATILNETLGEYHWGPKVGRLLRHSDYDAIHAHTSFMGGYLSRFCQLKIAYTSHSPLWFIDRLGPRERWGMSWERQAINDAKAVIVLTEEQWGKVFPFTRRHLPYTIPNGVDCELFKPGARTGNKVCVLGKVIPRKRIHLVADATYLLGAEFHIIGPTPEKDYAKQVRLTNPNAIWHSGLPEQELATLLGSMDIFVHASEAEAMSLAILEAMASGLPIVYASPYQNVVQDAGIQVKQNDQSRAYVDAIGQLLASETQRELLGQKARSIAKQNYAWEVVAKQVEEVYEALADMPS